MNNLIFTQNEFFAKNFKENVYLHPQYAAGGVAERLNASVLKTDVLERVPGVRIPPPPLSNSPLNLQGFLYLVGDVLRFPPI